MSWKDILSANFSFTSGHFKVRLSVCVCVCALCLPTPTAHKRNLGHDWTEKHAQKQTEKEMEQNENTKKALQQQRIDW